MSDIKTITVNGTQYDIKDATARADCSDLKSALDNESLQKAAVSEFFAPFDVSSYIIYQTGEHYSGTTGAKCTEFIPIKGFSALHVESKLATNAALVAFYDKDYNYLQSISVASTNPTTGGQVVDIDLTQPSYDDAYYVIASNYSVSYPVCKLVPLVNLASFEADAMKKIAMDPAAYNNNLASVDKTGFSSASSSFEDIPPFFPSSVIQSYKYSQNYALQVAYNLSNGRIATRVVKCSTGTVYRDWVLMSSDDYEYSRILCVGDSIAYGMRNNNKGFVGDLDCTYANKAISGATISNYNEPTLRSVPRQLVEAYGTIDFYPDNIIAEGGINDFNAGVPLGTMSTVPVKNDTEAAALDRDTLIGATEYLFYQMIKIYPKAHRFFLISHKTNNCPFTDNSAGYNQQEMHDAFVNCCKLYNVEVIDVYEESVINTMYSTYKSTVPWSEDPTIADNAYVDSDGIHPCKYGYEQGYVPLVKRALKIGVRNH